MREMKIMQMKKILKVNNLQYRKSAFTLAELLCVIAIVGICTALALTMMKPADKSAMRYLYMNAYSAVEKAYYNASLRGMGPFSQQSDEDGNPPVFSDTQDTGAKRLCEGLTFYINTTTNEKTEDDDYSTTCSDTKLTSELANDFDRDNIQFTANNGMEFYISKRLSINPEDPNPDYFYLVFVDVNGAKGPNSVLYTYKGGKTEDDYNDSDEDDRKQKAKDKIEPDIFAFAILESGRICPIGIPEYDSDILTARFAYFESNGNVLYTNKSMAYYQAKSAAWGFYNTEEPVDEEEVYDKNEPFTMNGIIRAAIDQNSLLVNDFPNLSELEPIAIQSENPYNCSRLDYESCYIFLDTYRQF